MNRLNGWKRLGIVVTVGWLIYLGWSLHIAKVRNAEAYANIATFDCQPDVNVPIARECVAKGDAARAAAMKKSMWTQEGVLNDAPWVIAPIALLWGLGYVVAWVRRGFRPSTSEPRDR